MTKRNLADGIPASDLGEGGIIAGTVHGSDVVLVRRAGKVCALSGTCPHAGASLADGIVAHGTLRCPWHHARFDVMSGEAVSAPAFSPLDRFEVIEDGDTIRVGKPLPAAAPAKAPAQPGRVVIIGGGAAGHACAEMLARHGAGAAVTLLSDESDAPYDRTACSKQYLAGEAERADLSLPSPADVTLHMDKGAARIDRAARTVHTADGDTFAYDTLVLATGAAPVVPDFAGADRSDAYVLRTLADADALIAVAKEGQRAIVVGSSYIGLEAAAALVARNLSVIVVSNAAIPLQQTAGDEVGTMIRHLHESNGVVFAMERTVSSWDGRTATLDDGTRLDGDLIVLGTGVKPRVDLAKAAGLTLADDDAGGGVAVDAMLVTSDPAIRAIGDIASVPDPRLGHAIRVEHWAVAQHMGQWLARHLLGLVEGGYDDVPFFWSGHYDVSLRYVGHVASPADRSIDGTVEDRDVAVYFSEDGEREAVLTCGRDRAALVFEHALETR